MNSVVHVYNKKLESHGQPVVVCGHHLPVLKWDFPELTSEVKLIGETDAKCYLCFRRDRVVQPLSVLEYFVDLDAEHHDRCSVLARALGYASLEDAFMQLAIQRKLDADDKVIMGE